MSRAFVREAENDKAELPDRPISPHRNFVTEAGLAAIEAALEPFRGGAPRRNETKATGKPPPPLCGKSATGGRGARARKSSNHPADKSNGILRHDRHTARRDDGREQSFRIVDEDEADA